MWYKYEVIVGNVGTVYTGPVYRDACEDFILYVERSRRGVGRGAGESVVLMEDGEILREYDGADDDNGPE